MPNDTPNFRLLRLKTRRYRPAAADSEAYLAAKRLRSSKRWQSVRAQKLGEAPICESCGDAIATEVHHILAVAAHPELAFVPDNLQSLCSPCHQSKGGAHVRQP